MAETKRRTQTSRRKAPSHERVTTARPAANKGPASKKTSKKAAKNNTASKRTAASKQPSRTRAVRGSTSDEPANVVHLRSSAGVSVALDLHDEKRRVTLQQLAMRWAHVVRNRRRWSKGHKPTKILEDRAAEALEAIGVRATDLEMLGQADHVEVSMPFATERTGWEARVFPWEYMLSAATKRLRGKRGVMVSRHLQRRGAIPAFGDRPRMLVVESAPGEIGDAYALDWEGRLVLASFGEWRERPLRDPTPRGLRQHIERTQPQTLHFTGVDTLQGRELAGSSLSKALQRDGLCLRDDDMRPCAIPADDIARIFNSARRKPALVSLTAFNTAARTSALTVARGAGAAIGFQDRFDEVLAELFYTTFYRALALSGHDLCASFRVAWEALRERPDGLRGTGIVLWSARSLLDDQHQRRWTELRAKLHEERRSDWTPSQSQPDLRDLLEVEVIPERSLNYAVLHNDCDLFETFVIRKLVPNRIRDAEVHVELHVGAHRFPFRGNVDLQQPIEDLGAGIRVPLTWELAGSIVESVRSALFVDVRIGDRILHRTTHAVELLPPSEWRDNEQDGPWLPSFVLPRDPAIEGIVAKAQRYLRALTDDPDAAFDGYQSVDPSAEDPGATIDLQVRALWSSLLHEFELAYVNPPPSYTPGNQRLRTPTDVLRSGTGTCIDLALLLASLLEYVEIYPVLVLLEAHAFVGYWRTLEGHERFLDMASVFEYGSVGEAQEEARENGDAPEAVIDTSRSARPRHRAYVVGPSGHKELVTLIEHDDLVPVEATSLASRDGFATAVEEGTALFADPSQFHSLLDLRLAREQGVTPLPLRGATRRWENRS
jgi:hypothetical protein